MTPWAGVATGLTLDSPVPGERAAPGCNYESVALRRRLGRRRGGSGPTPAPSSQGRRWPGDGSGFAVNPFLSRACEFPISLYGGARYL